MPNLDDHSISVNERFAAFKMKFGRRYTKSNEERALQAFIDNDAIIKNHNLEPSHTYSLGHNQFSDITFDEFKQRMGLRPPPARSKNYDFKLLNTTVDAKSIDWVEKGAVTPIKNQGNCGSCWAFGATAALEGAYQIAGNPLTSFSEQMLVSCDTGDDGCDGGLEVWAFDYITKHGLCTEADYPYTEKPGESGDLSGKKKNRSNVGSGPTGVCRRSCKPAVAIDGHRDIPNEAGILPALAKGPVSLAIDAGGWNFMLYKDGSVRQPGLRDNCRPCSDRRWVRYRYR
jgi:KDEL-tailed cysteine endopeptidase